MVPAPEVVAVCGGSVLGEVIGVEATTAVKGRSLTSESAVDTAQKAIAVVTEVATAQRRTKPERCTRTIMPEQRSLRIKRA
ncbi:MAG: hypothetical protein ACRDWA_16055 [Acidimicrobiia bacterium]